MPLSAYNVDLQLENTGDDSEDDDDESGSTDNDYNNTNAIKPCDIEFTSSIDDRTALENEIIQNEKQYKILLNDTSKLENEIIRNEKGWRKYVKSLPSGQRRGNNEGHGNQKSWNSNNRKNENDYNKTLGTNNHQNNGENDKNDNDDDEDKEDKKGDKDNDDMYECYDINTLKEKMKKVKATVTYKKIKNTRKYALNDNELMAIVYYTDSDSCCTKMKLAHRCIIADEYWQETYYHCTNAVEKIYQVLHYKNDEFKQNNDMSQ
eukprot:150107_1